MYTTNQIVSLRLMLVTVAALLMVACASSPSKSSGNSAQAQTEAAADIEPWDGDGMDIPLDGSSLEAFEKSLARIKAHTTPEQYDGLNSAIDYLMVYDIGAKKDRAILASRLDGMTGTQVLSQINWRKPGPGRSPAEKDAADAKLVND